MSSSGYKLHYFSIRGLGEPIRLILTYCRIPFEDIRIKERSPEWYQTIKPKTPMGQVPVLELPTGEQLCQSTAICRFLGERHGLTVTDPMKKVVVEQWLAGGWDDLNPYTVAVAFESDPERKKILFNRMVEEFLRPRLSKFEKFLAENGTQFLASDKPIWADFVLYNNFFMCISMWLKLPLLDEFPKITEYCKAIENLPELKHWFQSQRGVQWSWEL